MSFGVINHNNILHQ